MSKPHLFKSFDEVFKERYTSSRSFLPFHHDHEYFFSSHSTLKILLLHLSTWVIHKLPPGHDHQPILISRVLHQPPTHQHQTYYVRYHHLTKKNTYQEYKCTSLYQMLLQGNPLKRYISLLIDTPNLHIAPSLLNTRPDALPGWSSCTWINSSFLSHRPT